MRFFRVISICFVIGVVDGAVEAQKAPSNIHHAEAFVNPGESYSS